MTDDEYRINEECGDGPCGSGKVSVVAAGLDEVLRAIEDKMRKNESERPSMKMKNIATVNYMIGKLDTVKDILDDVDGYNPRIEDYLGADTRDEYDAALLRARKAVKEMFTILTNEVKEQNKVLDVWKEKEESDDEGA